MGLGALIVLVAAACGPDDPDIAVTGDPSGQPVAVEAEGQEPATVVAQDIEFDVSRIDAVAGSELTVRFDNQDESIPHNFHVQTGPIDAMTDIAPGPNVQDLTVTFDDPGSYEYICDVHPTQMTGTIEVAG